MVHDISPLSISDIGEISIHNVAFPTYKQALEITIADDKVAKIDKSDGPVDWICLPPLADKHMHANRAFTLGNEKPESFDHAIQMTLELFQKFTADDYSSHAKKLFERAYSHGTSAVRTHADIDTSTNLDAVSGTLAAKKVFAGKMNIEVVAFASSRLDPCDSVGRAMIKDAIEMGADIIGAVPIYYAEPRRSINALMDLAIELDVPIDVHQDEHLNADNIWSEYLADATISNNLQGRVTLSHGCALSAIEEKERDRIIDKLAAAQITVVSLPITNLYLQDRQAGTPARRGLTCVHELLRAGIEVRFATDNVRDAFYPYGNADLLDTAYVAMLASQIDSTEVLVKAICDGRSDLAVNDIADLVLIKGSSFDEVLSKRPAERVMVCKGKPVSGH